MLAEMWNLNGNNGRYAKQTGREEDNAPYTVGGSSSKGADTMIFRCSGSAINIHKNLASYMGLRALVRCEKRVGSFDWNSVQTAFYMIARSDRYRPP